jgi:hypothetical protein
VAEKVQQERPIEELQAGDEFRRSLVAAANAHSGGAPLWHGWALMDAFLAGVDWARARQQRKTDERN